MTLLKKVSTIVLFLGFFFVQGKSLAQEIHIFTNVGSFPFSIAASINKIVVLEDPTISVNAALSFHAIQFGLNTSLALGPIGLVGLETDLAYAFGYGNTNPGLRTHLGAQASIGPIALALNGKYWSTASNNVQPLAELMLNPEPNAKAGWLAEMEFGYRLDRNLIFNSHLHHVVAFVPDAIVPGLRPRNHGESLLGLGLEWRDRDFRISAMPTLVFQHDGFGIGSEFVGRLAPRDQNYVAGAQVFLGMGASGFLYGMRGSFEIGLPDELGNANAYLAFEPWRTEVLPLRFGANLEFNLGPGVLYTNASAGWECVCGVQWGMALGYRLPLASFFP